MIKFCIYFYIFCRGRIYSTRNGFDESNPYLNRRDACPTVLYRLLRAYSNTPLLLNFNSCSVFHFFAIYSILFPYPLFLFFLFLFFTRYSILFFTCNSQLVTYNSLLITHYLSLYFLFALHYLVL